MVTHALGQDRKSFKMQVMATKRLLLVSHRKEKSSFKAFGKSA